MSPVPPAVADALNLLQMDLYGHLDEAEFLACKFQDWTEEDLESARKLIPDLVRVIRGLLLEHQVRPDSQCRICRSAWPCPVVTTLHAALKDSEREFCAIVRRASGDE
ncbi:MAG: hypothetical protein ACRDTF_19650 [Pseudonocardiaceae bacterium]